MHCPCDLLRPEGPAPHPQPNQAPRQGSFCLAFRQGKGGLTTDMPNRLYAISRIQPKPGIWCWQVAFRRRGRHYYKSFYDLHRGGPEKSLAAAIAWRDTQLAKIKALDMREFRQLLRATNTSGVPGVQFIRPKNQPLGSWQARLKLPDGKERTRTFAVGKHGHDGAFALAVAARAEFLAEVEDAPFLHHPAARAFEAERKAGTAETPGQE